MVSTPLAVPLLGRLGAVAAGRGLDSLAEKLAALQDLTGEDMAAIEGALAELPRPANHVARASHHLLDLGGKRLRPLCVALAARAGGGFTAAARELAVAVEMVHAATLLHDDVIDLGATRRGAPAARVVYGNAASIYAGDWLLVDALRRVRRARVSGALDRLLDTIEEMIFAESIQLENRGRIGDREDWRRVVEGKTAALFRWAMWAGARAGGLDDAAGAALEAYGLHLGVAFQAIDDLLDLAGDPAATGKAVLTDLREGKITYPLLVALEREAELRPLLVDVIGHDEPPAAACARVRELVERAGGLDATQALARDRAQLACAALEPVPRGPARDALATVARAAVDRRR
jgi:octaprenyl-diphosphate synthase